MANIKSQIKRNKQTEKRNLRNRKIRAEMGTRIKTAEAAIGTENETEALRLAIKRIDKAQAKGVLHKNTAARRKGRLVARIKTASSNLVASATTLTSDHRSNNINPAATLG
ncbi:MAG: 30S ribosomal protein S20 [Acidimicrobiales bacterium]